VLTVGYRLFYSSSFIATIEKDFDRKIYADMEVGTGFTIRIYPCNSPYFPFYHISQSTVNLWAQGSKAQWPVRVDQICSAEGKY